MKSNTLLSVQTSIFDEIHEDNMDWKTSVESVLSEIESANELPKQSLRIKANKKNDKATVTSFSICIFEQDYPVVPNEANDAKCSTVILKVAEVKSGLDLLVSEQCLNEIGAPQNATLKKLKSDEDSVHVIFDHAEGEFIEFIRKNVEYALANYTGRADRFCCCDKFIECSNAKKCLHENKLYSLACSYRKNLEAGKIFYGDNKNI